MANNICHIPPVQPRTQPHAVNLPQVPAVVIATPSNLQRAVNALRQMVLLLSGQTGPGGSVKSPSDPKPVRWKEFSRQSEDVVIKDPNSGASITVRRINQLIMHDQITKEDWTFNRQQHD